MNFKKYIGKTVAPRSFECEARIALKGMLKILIVPKLEY